MRKLRLRNSQHWVGFNPPCPKTKASAPSSLCCLRLETHRDHKFRERGAPWRLKHSKVKVIQLHVTLWDPMDCSPPGSTVHGILQARILEWVAIPFCKTSSWPKPGSPVLHRNSLPSKPPGKSNHLPLPSETHPYSTSPALTEGQHFSFLLELYMW